MSALSIQDRVNFIRGIDIVAPHGHGGVQADGQDSAFVAAGSGLAFADVINSTLFAQLAANKQHDRWNEASAWLNYYKYVLEQLGYLKGMAMVCLVDNVVLKLAAKFLPGEEFALFTTMVESLKQARNESAMRLFDSYSKSSNKANFQLGVASNSNTEGHTVLNLGVHYYSTEQNIDIDSALYFKFGSQKVQFYAGDQTLLLDNQTYSLIREEILEKLGPKAKVDLVKEIKL
ncbi:hypothetical protein K466DRAFT_662571 [Polyporus arcularius HHB13444]|uniref:Uncharacterized protein n=1 Tax=Polyporus arcularius HHB13444 TaxID=1314778 RepID=A0A5C3PE75_9APHY|nr:hypothetical protein K466DRAFT_662571 [Polyporus arcularius HHB13444]